MIHNVHQRELPVAPAVIGRLLDGIQGSDSPIWPVDTWPAVRFDRPMAVGATGGHGPVRYSCTAYRPGRMIECTFSPGFLIQGTHTLDVLDGPTQDSCVLRHVIDARPHGIGHLAWPLVFRWLHDALFEDLLDRAATAVGHPPIRPARWSPWVRFLRRRAQGGVDAKA
ncbi:MAG TPA: SRPBCC family protein [Actinokineospora sp.]|nr:SRPBCC family protein [Actinokineospora sp.]